MISIIIPTLNESTTIGTNLLQLSLIKSPEDEVIVVDGESNDNTSDVVKTYPCVTLIKSDKTGRSAQMNYGAAKARGDYLLFLHADTKIDEEAIRKLRMESDKKTPWGWFNIRLDSEKRIYRILETLARWRTMMVSEPLGDHGIFVRRDIFEEAGGYPDVGLMEDVELVRKLKDFGEGKRIEHYVLTSVRRFEKQGITKTLVNICLLRTLYFLGVSNERLSKKYNNVR